MKDQKIYSKTSYRDSLYYFRILDNEDRITEDCFLRFGSDWVSIAPDSAFMGRQVKDIQGYDKLVFAKRFDNLF